MALTTSLHISFIGGSYPSPANEVLGTHQEYLASVVSFISALTLNWPAQSPDIDMTS